MPIRETSGAATLADIAAVRVIGETELHTVVSQQHALLAGCRWRDAQQIGRRITELSGKGWLEQLADYITRTTATVQDWQAVDRTLVAEYEVAVRRLDDVRTVAAYSVADLAYRTLQDFRADALRTTGDRPAFASLPPAPSAHPNLFDLWRLGLEFNERKVTTPVDRSRWQHLLA